MLKADLVEKNVFSTGLWADVEWTGKWSSFLDTMLQASLLCTTSRNLAVPVDFEKIIIDPVVFKKHLKEPEEGRERKPSNFMFRLAIISTQSNLKKP